jgi:hypothetical protein
MYDYPSDEEINDDMLDLEKKITDANDGHGRYELAINDNPKQQCMEPQLHAHQRRRKHSDSISDNEGEQYQVKSSVVDSKINQPNEDDLLAEVNTERSRQRTIPSNSVTTSQLSTAIASVSFQQSCVLNPLSIDLHNGKMQFMKPNGIPNFPTCWSNYGIPLSVDIAADHIHTNFLLPRPTEPSFQTEVSRLFGHRTVLIRSPMGTGKSKAYMWYIQSELSKHHELKVLVICSRVTLVASLTSELNNLDLNFKSYSDFDNQTNEALQMQPRLVIQLDSLPRLVPTRHIVSVPYDIVILDESESALKHFDAETMKRRGVVWSVFISICRSTPQLLVFDADLGGRTIDIISSLRSDVTSTIKNPSTLQFTSSDIKIWINDKQTDTKTYIYPDTDSGFHYILWQLLKQKNNIAIACNCKKKALELEAEIKSRCDVQDILVYHSDSSDQQKQAVGSINESWIKQQVVIFTPTIGAGVDFNPPAGHFHYVMAYGIASSNPVREFMQMIGRIRWVKKNHVIVYLPNTRCSSSPFTLESILQQVCNDYYQMHDPFGLLEPMRLFLEPNEPLNHITPSSFRDQLYTSLYCWNQMESALSESIFPHLFRIAVRNRGGQEVEFTMDSKNIWIIGAETNRMATEQFMKQIIDVVDAKVMDEIQLDGVQLRHEQKDENEYDKLVLHQHRIIQRYRLHELKVYKPYVNDAQRDTFIEFIRYHGSSQNNQQFHFFLQLHQPTCQSRSASVRAATDSNNIMLYEQQKHSATSVRLVKALLVLIGAVKDRKATAINYTTTTSTQVEPGMVWTSRPHGEYDNNDPHIPLLDRDDILDTATLCTDVSFNTLEIETRLNTYDGHTWVRNNLDRIGKHLKVNIRDSEHYIASDVTKSLRKILESKLGLSLPKIEPRKRVYDETSHSYCSVTTWNIGERGRLLSMMELAYVREWNQSDQYTYFSDGSGSLFNILYQSFRWTTLTGIQSPMICHDDASSNVKLLPMTDVNELDMKRRKRKRNQVISNREPKETKQRKQKKNKTQNKSKTT